MAILWEHHIIPRCFEGHPALEDIDINAPENLIYLPQDTQLAARMGVSPHSGGHLASYFAVKNVLDQLAMTSDRSLRNAELRKLQDAMRIGLANGDLYTNNPGTDADADSINPKLITNHNGYLVMHPDKVQELRDLRQEAIDTGNPNLEKFSAIRGNRERERLLDEAIANNPGIKITARNKDLGGTRWHSEFAAVDDNFNIPPSAPTNPGEVPSLPPFIPPSLRGLDEPEGLTRSDPRHTGVLPAFPELSQNEQRLGQLPPTTATPSDPLVLKSDPMTGVSLPFYENPLANWSSANGSSSAQDLLPWLAVAAANAQGLKSEAAGDVVTDGGVFSTGVPGSDYLASSAYGSSLIGPAPLDQAGAGASTFADRFGNWTDSPTGTMPSQSLEVAPVTPAAQAAAPDDVRRLTRVNESNAGSVFTTGSAPVPYLPSTEFNDRFGNWRTSTGDGGAQQASRPISAFADEPSYFIPPPIFGSHDSSSDTDEWLSRWIRPLLRPD
ncbi:AHH domain-containing protein [Bradyrhizobium sp. A5]|uniref:AHH domain-containing protein n=1 Tax=Bradyrhizobium sp. A5 TaxID=3133696 RepID=UPI003254A288